MKKTVENVKKVTPKKAVKKTPSKTGLEVSVFDTKGQEVEKIMVPENIFNVKASDKLLTQYVRVYLANQRQGTKSVKTRAEVVGSTRKIYKQKGTGRARHGARKASLFVGGGVTHGPHPIEYRLSLNKKQKRKALYYALTKKLKENDIYFISGFLETPGKTKEVATILNTIPPQSHRSKLVVYPKGKARGLILGARNIKNVYTTEVGTLNAYEIIKNKQIIFTKEALDSFIAPI